MQTATVFGERVAAVGSADVPPPRLVGPLLLPAGQIRPTPGNQHLPRDAAGASTVTAVSGTPAGGAMPDDDGAAPGSVLLPGPGATTAARAEHATCPASAARTANAAAALGIHLTVQDEVDVRAAARLCPTDGDEVRHASAALELGAWRYRIQHAPPGSTLARLLEQRPDELRPAPGSGPVTRAQVRADGTVGAPMPADEQWPRAVLDSIVARQRLLSHLHAEQYRDVAALSGCYPGIHQYLSTELALALHTTDADATALLGAAEALRDRLPETLTHLANGRIDDGKAMALVRATGTSTPDVARTVEQQVLPHAQTVTATTVARRARRAVIAADPDGAADRHRRARTDRHAWRAPADDGMARLGVHAPADDVTTIWDAITAVADAITTPGDTRTLGQRRTDALTMICSDILAGGGWAGLKLPDTGRARPRITVTVPYTVLLGHRAPCELAGHGPISTEQALPLIGGGDLYRMICDPVTGQTLDYGHTRYRPPPHLAEFVRVRDGECPMPSCHQPAERGHVDHIVPAKPDPQTGKPTLGVTAAHNLAPPCGHHHNGKDAGRGFHLHRSADGTYTWTTPLGRVYAWRPEPHWHPDTDTIPTGAGGPTGIPEALLRTIRHTADGAAVPTCDCPATCPCQQPALHHDAGEPPPLTIPGDWADGCAPNAATATGATAVPAEPGTDGDPPPF